MDWRRTECFTCGARGEYAVLDPICGGGEVRWSLKKEAWEEPWNYSTRGYLPTLCLRCADRRCPVCGR